MYNLQVAEAPKVRNNRVQDIAELDEDMHFRLPSNEDRDIDLSLLTGVLCSSEQVGKGASSSNVLPVVLESSYGLIDRRDNHFTLLLLNFCMWPTRTCVSHLGA